MKEVKETIKTEYTVIKYQSFDGEKFDTEEECQKYENSAAGVLFCKIDDFTVKADCAFEPDEGSDENKYKAVIPRNQRDIDLLNQLWKLYSGRNREDIKFDGTYIKSLIFIGYRFDYSNPGELDWVWFYDIKGMVERACENKYTVKLIDNNED